MKHLGLLVVVMLASAAARAGDYTHAIQPGETLETLAKAYYGSSWKSVYLGAKNGLPEDKEPPQKRIVVPSCFTYKVKKGDSVTAIAKRYLGNEDRYKALMQENGLRDPSDLAVGAELVMPFHLKHTVESGESLSTIARRYYRTTRKASLLRDYNKIDEVKTGDRITVPIFDRATLDPDKRKPAPPVKGAPPPQPDPEPAEAKADAPSEAAKDEKAEAPALNSRAALKKALEAFDDGEYPTSCKSFESLLGERSFSVPERIAVVSHLGICAVASSDRNAALDYFKKWLELDPKAELDPIATSPKILDVFHEAVEAQRAVAAALKEEQ